MAAWRIRHGQEEGHFSGPVLVLCPKSVVQVWPEQLKLHGGISNVLVIEGDKLKRKQLYRHVRPGVVVVANYEKVRADITSFRRMGFEAVVLDEIHRVKSMTSKSHKAVREICANAKYSWGLSGTPAPNNPLDICGVLSCLDHGVFGYKSWTNLRNKYTYYHHTTPWTVGTFKDGAIEELQQKTQLRSSRLLKADAVDLPEKTYEKVFCTLPPRWQKLYDQLKKQSVAKLEELGSAGSVTLDNVLVETGKLLQMAGGFLKDDGGKIHEASPNAKLDALVDLSSDIGGPFIVWTAFVAEAKAVAAALRKAKMLVSLHHGTMANEDRKESIDSFRGGHTDVLVSTAPSAREGLTLTRASTAVYYSRGWNMVDYAQSQDRIHRIGQDRKVTIINMIAKGTVDHVVDKVLSNKATAQELLLSGGILNSEVFNDS